MVRGTCTAVRTWIIVLATLLLAACGGGEQPPAKPTAHLRAAERICTEAQPAVTGSSEGLANALEAYGDSGSSDDFDAVGRAWDDVWYAMDRTRKELRAATAVGSDRDYDRFVTAWAHLTNALRGIVDAHEHGFHQLVGKMYGQLDTIAGRLHGAARTAGVVACEAPLTAPPEGRET
jgi:hypothetical protein